jgi:hypothetical protein
MSNMENQSQSEPSVQNAGGEPLETSVYDMMPLLDENDNPIEAPQKDNAEVEGDDEAGSDTDEPKALQLTDDLEIVLDGDKKITGESIKQLITLQENYTQQRQADTQKVREFEQQAHQHVSERVQEYAAFTGEALRLAESIALGGYTRDQIKYLWRTDPDSADILEKRASQFDALLEQAGQQVGKWKKEHEHSVSQKSQLEQQTEAELVTNETRKLCAQPWFKDVQGRLKEAQAYQGGLKIPAARLESFMNTADGVKVLYQSMMYEKSQARIQSGKQPAKVTNTTPGAQSMNGPSSEKKQFAALAQRAKAGDKNAQARIFAASIPILKD